MTVLSHAIQQPTWSNYVAIVSGYGVLETRKTISSIDSLALDCLQGVYKGFKGVFDVSRVTLWVSGCFQGVYKGFKGVFDVSRVALWVSVCLQGVYKGFKDVFDVSMATLWVSVCLQGVNSEQSILTSPGLQLENGPRLPEGPQQYRADRPAHQEQESRSGQEDVQEVVLVPI
uniref:Uncharacterized protein n=1 Tax=Timema poppense TaxID=170557 RepID=A0A7R9H3X7_TIMPO|nr:unnamed protein product [Timema poppensis]